MLTNNSLKDIEVYKIEISAAGMRRCHNNEAVSSILPLEILAKDVFCDLNLYPEKEYDMLIKKAAEFYKISADCVIATNGSDEAIDLIIRTFCNNGDKIAVLEPTFSMYEKYARISGIDIAKFSLNANFEIDLGDFCSFLERNMPKIAFIPNPLAPSGGLTKNSDIIGIIEKFPDIVFVIDEAYIEFCGQDSLIYGVKLWKNLIITRTFSKFYGLAGIRLGFCFTSQFCDIMKVKSPYNVNSISCRVGINFFNNISDIVISKRYNGNIIAKGDMRDFLLQFDEVEKIYDSFTNFLFVKLGSSGKDFGQKLQVEYGMVIKTFSGKFANFVRICV
ncbi:pyridoxal phosphate-dependent aminotransferase [Candidatus Deianiraea vastatrix]|uniref:Histidinol-phosphate aminotransferase n=1 Tax=Candidatus Deianiraea vastatrix TaxID=2163644 RepID=A0A5B8XJ13_9RICK|nr:histidinol-phosphate transaminase [Candidatus Deianiraea vastatrix]QED23607.1 Histidinol-phosphate aminotransferase [Candidatus Deianiraea vastatrix]